MNELPKYMRMLTFITLSFIAVCLLGAAVFTSYSSIFMGIALGAGVSYFNAYFLSTKIRKLTDRVAEGIPKATNLGFLTRASLAVLAVILAYNNPTFNLYSVALSLLFAQLILLIIGFIYSHKEN